MVRDSGGDEAVWQELQLPPPRPGKAAVVLANTNHTSPVAIAVLNLLKIISMALLRIAKQNPRISGQLNGYPTFVVTGSVRHPDKFED
jgi:hypothetical protein